VSETQHNTDARDERIDRVILDYLQAMDAGQPPDRRALLARYPDLAGELTAFFADQDRVARMAQGARGRTPPERRVDETTDEPARPYGPCAMPATIGGYRLLRLIGVGGMGRVYEAEDASGQRVAIKLLSPSVAGSPTALERFRQEGRLASRLTHPRCIFVRTADEDAGQPYIVMELMSGVTLKDLVEGTGPLNPTDAIARILDIIEGLEEAHRAGILHRDVKPANAYVDHAGRVKIGDFGLSRSLAAGPHLTRPGGFVGTPLFASPEQLKGEPLDQRTDVYSVAATLYYLLTGQAPFQHADAATVIARVVSEAPVPPRRLRPDLPPMLERVVLRGLERQRDRRFASLAEFREALLPLVPGQMTFAGLGLRVGAYLVDALPFAILAEVVALLGAGRGLLMSAPLFVAMSLPPFCYFWLSEGIWGSTPAKWLLRLRVTRARDGEPPGLGRTLLRTLLFVCTGGVLTNLALLLVLDHFDSVVWSLFSLAGTALSLAVRFSTMRARNGYQGFHEVLSGTRVVEMPERSRQDGHSHSAAEIGLEKLPGPQLADKVPEQVGPFIVRAVLRWEEEKVLSGVDPMLDRRVWIWLRPVKTAPLPAERTELARPARLRWLCSGLHGEWRWEAFVAPCGAPLAAWVASRGPLDWPRARALLEQLSEELRLARADGTDAVPLRPELVWFQPPDRALLIDLPILPGLAGQASSPGEKGPHDDQKALGLLDEVATLALEGAGAQGQPRKGALRAIVPLHACRMVDRLRGGAGGYRRLDELANDLAATRRRPDEVTVGLRAFHLAVTFCSVGLALLCMVAWSRNGAMADLIRRDRFMVRAQALIQVLDDPQLAGALLEEEPEEARAVLRAQQVRDSEAFYHRAASLGWTDLLIRAVPPLCLRHEIGSADERLRLEPRPGPGVEVVIIRLDLPRSEPLTLTSDGARELIRRARLGDAPKPGPAQWDGFFWLLLPIAIIPLFYIASAVLFRGGVTLRLVKLALVRGDGQEASRLRCGGRALLAWLPIIALFIPIVWIDLHHPELVWLCPFLQGVAVFLVIAHGAFALRFLRRTLPDRLAGTCIVPR
jgi:hypothetical protein